MASTRSRAFPHVSSSLNFSKETLSMIKFIIQRVQRVEKEQLWVTCRMNITKVEDALEEAKFMLTNDPTAKLRIIKIEETVVGLIQNEDKHAVHK